jgi:hypothetical protein
VAAQVTVGAVRLDHHGHGVPAHPRAQALFVFQIAGAVFFEVGRNGIDVSGVAGERDVGAAAARQIDQSLHQVMGAFRALVFNDGLERFEPFLGFERVGIIGGLGRQLVELS